MILFTMIYIMGMEEKSWKKQKRKKRKKITRLVGLLSHLPSEKNEAESFPVSEKQAGPTLGGTGILV